MKNILAFLACIPAFSTSPCIDPFAGNPSAFSLTSPTYCGAVNHYTYAISTNTYIKPVCVDTAKAIDLFQDDTIVEYSNLVSGTNWGTQIVTTSCDGHVQFSISTDPINQMSYQVFNNDIQPKPIAYVTMSENEDNQVTLRASNNATILAKAIRNLMPAPGEGCATTTWNVNNIGDLPPSIMAFLLSYKDSSTYVCPSASPSNPTQTSVSGTTIGVAIVLSVLGAAVTTATAINYYRKHHLKNDVGQALTEVE